MTMKCHGKKKDGQPCARKVQNGPFCKQHEDQAEPEPIVVDEITETVEELLRKVRGLERRVEASEAELGKVGGLTRQLHGMLTSITNTNAQPQEEKPEEPVSHNYHLAWWYARGASKGYGQKSCNPVSKERFEELTASYLAMEPGTLLGKEERRAFHKAYVKEGTLHIRVGPPIVDGGK